MDANQIRRIEVPHQFSSSVLSEQTVMVILDVYMFSSTVLTLHHHGVDEVIPVHTADELQEYQDNGMLVGGERELNQDFSNSPQNVFATFGVMDEIPSRVALTSDNGAKRCVECVEAIEENGYTDCPVIIGSSMNAKAVAEYINTNYPDHDVLLVCAGSDGESSAEDVIGALAISQYLRGEEVPLAEYKEMLSVLPAGSIENEFPWLSDEDVLHISTVNKFDFISKYDFTSGALRKTE